MRKKKRKHSLQLLSFIGVAIAICITTIGYSAFNANLSISGEAIVKAGDRIDIVDVSVSSTENGAYEQYNNSYTSDSVNYHISLPQADSTITYKISIRNGYNKNYGIAMISLPSNTLTYELIGYNLGDKLCTNSSTCNNGVTDEIYLKVKYKDNMYDSENIGHSGVINFDFEHFANVIYKNVANSNSLKHEVLKNTTYTESIVIPENKKLVVKMDGITLLKDIGYSYDENTNVLTVPNVIANLTIIVEDLSVDFAVDDIEPGSSFAFRDTGYDINNATFYLEADLSTVASTEVFENIISIGNDIDTWAVSYGKKGAVNLHVYYPAILNTSIFQIDASYLTEDNVSVRGKMQKQISLNNAKLLRLAINGNGLYINGFKIFDKTSVGSGVSFSQASLPAFVENFFTYWENNENANNYAVDIGSLEGSTRSNATYRDIKILNRKLTAEELIEKTKVEVAEEPDFEEISYDSVSAVRVGYAEATPVVFPFQPNNSKFVFMSPEFNNLNSNSLYMEMDVSNLKEGALLENLISVGNNLSSWTANNVYDFHIFYPNTVGSTEIVIALLIGNSQYAQFRKSVNLIDGKYIKMYLCKNGLYINGEEWLDYDGFITSGTTSFGVASGSTASNVVMNFFAKFTYPNDPNLNFSYGSEQGANRSSATYNDIRIYNGTLTKLQIIELTS